MKLLGLLFLLSFNVLANETAIWTCGYNAKFNGPEAIINEKGGYDIYARVRKVKISGNEMHYLKANGSDDSALLFSYPNIHGKTTEITLSSYNKTLSISVNNGVKPTDPEAVSEPTFYVQIGDKANDSSFRTLFTTEDRLRIEIDCTKILVRADKQVDSSARENQFKPSHPIMDQAGSDSYSSVLKD